MDVQESKSGGTNSTALIAALEDEKFKWRTVDGIAKELNESPGQVLADLQPLIDQGIVIRSSVPAKSGGDLFTTRKHYRSLASPVERLLAAIRNRAA